MSDCVAWEVDVGGTMFSVTWRRSQSVDFSAPLYIDQSNVMYMKPEFTSDVGGFIKPYTLTELLSKEELGGEKPTDLLRCMKKLLGDKYTSFDKELFLQLFYQRLPPDTQRCLFTVKNKLSVDELATLAD
ncbi:hypothetical protein O3P69_014600 [Scylla paramamosain]|uniref:Uncharacterized protein n=1 Tax=Scylla paramamosain TaxID=85552 RepID=A0AAW0TX48_SCYPA